MNRLDNYGLGFVFDGRCETIVHICHHFLFLSLIHIPAFETLMFELTIFPLFFFFLFALHPVFPVLTNQLSCLD